MGPVLEFPPWLFIKLGFPPLATILPLVFSFSQPRILLFSPCFFNFCPPLAIIQPLFFHFFPPLATIRPLVLSFSHPWVLFSPRFSNYFLPWLLFNPCFPTLGSYPTLGLYSAGKSITEDLVCSSHTLSITKENFRPRVCFCLPTAYQK